MQGGVKCVVPYYQMLMVLSSSHVSTYAKLIFSASSQLIWTADHSLSSLILPLTLSTKKMMMLGFLFPELHGGGGGTPHTPTTVQPLSASSYRELQLQHIQLADYCYYGDCA